MNKVFYAFWILLILFLAAIVTVVNSSKVIDKIAKEFAPDYKLSYEHISGNILTGIKIDKLKYADKTIANNIVYKWDLISLLQKKLSIEEIRIENANISVIKALVASFDVDKSDDTNRSSSEPFSFDINIDDVFISLSPFEQETVAFSKVVLEASDMIYEHEGRVELRELFLDIDSNLTKFSLKGSLSQGKLTVDNISVLSLDTQMLEGIIEKFTAKSSENKTSDNSEGDKNSLIPTAINIKSFDSSLLPRTYMKTYIKKLDFQFENLSIDTAKMMANEKNSFSVENIELHFDSNNSAIDMKAKTDDEKVIFEYLSLRDVNILAFEKLFGSDRNESTASKSKKDDEKSKKNALIPKVLIIKKLKTNVLPLEFSPLKVKELMLNANNVYLDLDQMMLTNASVDMNANINLANIRYKGVAKDNTLGGRIHLEPKEELFSLYDIPLRKEAINDIVLDFNASKEKVFARLKTSAKQILKAKDGEFNLDIVSLSSLIDYNIEEQKLLLDSKATLSTLYAKNIQVTNSFAMDKNISYHGKILAKEIIGFDARLAKGLSNLLIDYKGDIKSINTTFSSDKLKGDFVSKDFKKGKLHLESIEALKLSEFVDLPQDLKNTELNLSVDAPIDFKNIMPINAKAKVDSNLVNIDMDINYDKAFHARAKILLPENSLMKSFSEEVKWNALSPINLVFDLESNASTLLIKSKNISADVDYDFKSTKTEGKLSLAGLKATIFGKTKEKLHVNTKIKSIKSLKDNINQIYTMDDLPPVEGAVDISILVSKMKKVELSFASPKIVYKADRKTEHILKDVSLRLRQEESDVILKDYSLSYKKQKIFATKPSKIQINGDIVNLESFWLNDGFKVTGKYDLAKRKGEFESKAKKMHLAHEYADVDADIDLRIALDDEKTSIDGKIVLLGGNIKYDMAQKSFASDSDIIIVQEMKNKKTSSFMDKLSANIQIETKKPLVYKKYPVNIKTKVALGITKVQNSPLLVSGSVELLKEGSYIFEDKKFKFDKSFIYFSGDPSKPLLDVKVRYKALNHMIKIAISGTASTPSINFSSNPKLSKEQILSVILFDNEADGDAHSGDEMMRMMGGAMAKSALSDFGVKVDHLVLGENNSLEVGKKLNSKTTLIYVNKDEMSGVKLKYQHTKKLESILEANERSQSYDFIFKGDF